MLPVYRFYLQGRSSNGIISVAEGNFVPYSNCIYQNDQIEIQTNNGLMIHTIKTDALIMNQNNASLSLDKHIQFIGDYLTIKG